ncbi:MAG: hypothetical protein KDD34_09365 [Bdellovibrionales bacterium]|nr:hypothetical protein [Bdellovibrionales bacterium]
MSLKMFFIAVTFLFSGYSFANTDYSGAIKADQVRAKIEPSLFAMDGVNSVSVSLCDAETGDLITDYQDSGEFCVLVTTSDAESLAKVREQYPMGGRTDGVFVTSINAGDIVVEPRFTIGN